MQIEKKIIRINDFFLKNIKFFTLLLIIGSSLILLAGGFFFHPMINGDGNEYVGMTISLLNHGSPDFREVDAHLKQKIYSANDIHLNLTSGYHPSLRGTLEASHLWFYSLFVLPLFILFQLLSYNELSAFQFFNIILLIFTMIIIYRYDQRVSARHFWYIAFIISSPVLLYLHWTHTEVYSFCFVSLALFFVFVSEKRNYYLAVICSSLASLQNPPIAILTISLVFLGWRENAYRIVNLCYLLLLSSISSAPYLYSYYFFNTSNPQMFIGAANISYISLDKVLAIFIDLNSGIIIYLPVLFILSIILIPYSLIVHRNYSIIILWIIILALAVSSTTTGNWNCGMMYIFRYAVWIIPLFIAIVVYLPKFTSHYLVTLLLVFTLITTGMITTGCILEHRGDNYFMFNSFSKDVMTVFPGFYNPVYETFTERSVYNETSYATAFPIIVTNNNDIRKVFSDKMNLPLAIIGDLPHNDDEFDIINKSGMGYINGDYNLSLFPENKKTHIFAHNYLKKDVFDKSVQFIEYSKGWGDIVVENGTGVRWMEDEGYIAVISPIDGNGTLFMQGKSYSENHTMEIYVRNQLQSAVTIPDEIINHSISLNLKKGFNTIRFQVPGYQVNPGVNPFQRKSNHYSVIGFLNCSFSLKKYG